jgi:hypothetical protein
MASVFFEAVASRSGAAFISSLKVALPALSKGFCLGKVAHLVPASTLFVCGFVVIWVFIGPSFMLIPYEMVQVKDFCLKHCSCFRRGKSHCRHNFVKASNMPALACSQAVCGQGGTDLPAVSAIDR